MARHNQRKKVFIKNSLQGKLIFGFFLFVTGGFLFFLVLLGTFSANSAIPAVSHGEVQLQAVQNPLVLVKGIFLLHWLFILSGTLFFAISALLLSHRIAGPVFRFEIVIDEMLRKDLDNTIHLRRNDEGKKLAEKINALNRELSQSFKGIKSHSKAIASLLERADTKTSTLPEKQRQELKSIYWNLQENNKKIQAISKSYTQRKER